MTKSDILASNMLPVEKVWLIAKERSDIGTSSYGVVAARSGVAAVYQPGDSFVYEPHGCVRCPIGAVLLGEERDRGYHFTAAVLLGVTEEWVDAFVDGFDGLDTAMLSDPDGYAAGQEIRRRFEAMGVQLG